MIGLEDTMTSSFVAKILEHADQLKQKTIHDKLDILTMKLSEMEVEMHQLAESKYVHFHPNLATAKSLTLRVHDVQTQVSVICQSEMKGQLSWSTGEFQRLNQKMSKATTIMAGLTYLAAIHDLFESSARCLEAKKYSEAALALIKLETHFKQPLTELDGQITVLVAMKTELKVQFAKLECHLSDLWKDLINWTVRPSPEPATETCLKEISVSVACNEMYPSQLQELVEGLYMCNLLGSQMKLFADWFRNYLVPVVTENMQLNISVRTANNTKTLYVGLQDNEATLKAGSLKAKDSSKTIGEESMYTYVFGNLMSILEHLHALFLHVEYGRHDTTKLDVPSVPHAVSKGTLMSLLGQAVSPWLLDLLQKTVLAKAVPASAKDLEGFSQVIASTRLLQDEMVRLGFIEADNRSLLDYVQNVNMLFANKKSQATLEAAHALMTSDLHDTVAVTEDKPVGEWPPLTRGGVRKSGRLEVAADHQLSDNTFRLPKCRISENIQTLMMLAYETLSESTESSPECATQMFYAVRSMFELFYHVVPTHHGHNFESFPQLAALHHNNCMFIAHHLLTLGHQFAPKLPAPENKTFVDLIQKIRHSGVEIIIAQMNRQRDLLLGYLDGADGFGLLEEESHYQRADKAVRQVMLQLGHLQKMWKPVLPGHIYKKTMARLIQEVVVSVSDSVSSLEDIAEDGAHRLSNLLTSIEQECGDLLTSPGEVAAAELIRHVPNWCRLVELKFMLGASLSDIVDRWTDGTGPLSLSYSPMEVKQMIRALFQNTDRRANLLAIIK